MSEATGYNLELFASTAPYYSRFRAPYRDSMFTMLRRKFRLDGGGALLDLGCGTGPVAIPLAPMFERVLAMDPDDEMRAEGKRIARERGIRNIEWRFGGSLDLLPALGTFRLVTIGNAFHWMDRERTIEALYPLVADDGGIAIVGVGYPFTDEVPLASWRRPIEGLVRKYNDRFRGFGMAVTPENRHESYVDRSRFTRVERWIERYEQSWTLDELVGNLYSSSYCNPRVLGDRTQEFERELRAIAAPLLSSGVLTEPYETFALTAWKR
jgi:SAM-dependent methyltransferase